MSLNHQKLIRLTAIILVLGLLSCFINPIGAGPGIMDVQYLLKYFMSAVQLRIGFLDTNYGSPVDVLNLIFYALLLAGLVRFRNDEKDSRLLRFCFSIIFLDNFLSLALGILSILAAALNPYKDYAFSLYTV